MDGVRAIQVSFSFAASQRSDFSDARGKELFVRIGDYEITHATRLLAAHRRKERAPCLDSNAPARCVSGSDSELDRAAPQGNGPLLCSLRSFGDAAVPAAALERKRKRGIDPTRSRCRCRSVSPMNSTSTLANVLKKPIVRNPRAQRYQDAIDLTIDALKKTWDVGRGLIGTRGMTLPHETVPGYWNLSDQERKHHTPPDIEAIY